MVLVLSEQGKEEKKTFELHSDEVIVIHLVRGKTIIFLEEPIVKFHYVNTGFLEISNYALRTTLSLSCPDSGY